MHYDISDLLAGKSARAWDMQSKTPQQTVTAMTADLIFLLQPDFKFTLELVVCRMS